MSVINNVLKNLESRESRFTPIEMDSVITSTAPARDLKPWLLGSTLVLLLAVAAWMYLQNYYPNSFLRASPNPAPANIPAQTNNQAESETVAPTAAAPEQEAIAAAEPETGNQIVGLQISESEETMQMEFALREKVVVYLRERGENYFTYHLRDVESEIVAAEISDNEWLTDLSIVESESGVDIDFETTPDILVETRQELRDGEAAWLISLRKAKVPAASEPAVIAEPARQEPVAATVDVEPQEVAAVDNTSATQEASATATANEPPVEIDIKSTNPNSASINQLQYAVELINSGRTADAEVLLRGLLGGVEDYNARKHLLALYGQQKLAGRERQLLLESMVKYPEDALFRTEYGRGMFAAGSYRAVIEFFANERAVDATQQALLAASYQRLDEHEKAVQHYRLALEQDAGNARSWIGLGISLEHTAALEAALGSYQQAVKLGNLSNRLRVFVNGRIEALAQVLK